MAVLSQPITCLLVLLSFLSMDMDMVVEVVTTVTCLSTNMPYRCPT